MSQLPAYLQGKTSRGLAQALVANLGAGSPPFVSIKGNRFTLIDATGSEEAVETFNGKADQFGVVGPYLDAIIIDVNENTSHVFYDKAYDPSKEGEQPACWSDNGVAPSRNAQSPQARTCQPDDTNTFGCRHACWGSATSKVSGKGVKACHDVQKIALQLIGDDVVFLMRVPPNSRTNLRDYTLKFVGQQVDLSDVVTRISFDQQTLGTLQFVATGFIPEAEMHRRDKFLAEKKTDALVGRTDQPITPAAGQLAGPGPGTAALPAPVSMPAAAGVLQPAPFVPSAANPSAGSPQVQSTAPAGNAQTASPSEAPKQRRRRTAAQPETSQNPGQQAGQNPAPMTAPFRTDAPPTQPAQPSGEQFGMAQGVAPNPELTQVLDNIFGR